MAVKRLKTSEILNLTPEQLRKMTVSELRQATSELQSTARSRVRHLKDSNVASASPAYRNLQKYNVKFKGIEGISKKAPEKEQRRELMKRMMQARSFLTNPTSSIKETRKVMKNIMKTLGVKGQNLTDKQWERVWDVVDKYRELHPESKFGYRMAFQTIVDRIKAGTDSDDVLNDIEREHKRLYEENEDNNPEMWRDL